MTTIVAPMHYRVIRREGNTWHFRVCEPFFVPKNRTVADIEDYKGLFGVSRGQVAIALFRINGGREGFYLANLRSKEYYYCGKALEDVKSKLHELGIGRPDPMK